MILNQRTLALRAQVEDIVKDLQQLSQEIGHKVLAGMVGARWAAGASAACACGWTRKAAASGAWPATPTTR